MMSSCSDPLEPVEGFVGGGKQSSGHGRGDKAE